MGSNRIHGCRYRNRTHFLITKEERQWQIEDIMAEQETPTADKDEVQVQVDLR